MSKHSVARHRNNNKKDVKKNAIIDFLFLLIIFITIFGFCIAIIIRGQEEESVIENRKLAKFPSFNFQTFMNGEYQDNLEKSLADQMVAGQIIKNNMTTTKAEMVSNLQSKIISSIDNKTENVANENKDGANEVTEEKKKEVRNIKYIPISNNVYHYGDSEYMVFKYRNVKNYTDKIDQMAKVYNKRFADVDCYFYMVTNSKAINFNTVDETENEFLTYVKETFTNFKCDGLKIDSYEQYMDYFYETDHHWNYKGSYKGYTDIVNLLLPGEEVLKPTGTTTFDVYYYGSNARTTSIYTNKEKFTVYDFKLPKYQSYINGSMARYDNKSMYYDDQYSTEKGYNHYRAFYGGDYAEVAYDYFQPEKENLLVIAPSYSNAINPLLASHFNKTYYIDLRHYENEYGKDFNPEQYCKEHNIDKFLLLISIDHLTNGNFMLTDK